MFRPARIRFPGPLVSTRSGLATLAAAVLALPANAVGDPTTPVYFVEFADAVTGDNAVIGPGGIRYWPVDVGSDQYQIDVYERPTVQSYHAVNGVYGAREYWENLDIVKARLGFDTQYLYVAIDMFGLNRSDTGGNTLENLRYEYGFRVALDPDGRYGMLFVADSPFDASSNPTTYGKQKTFGYRDTDGDVGGAADSGPTGLSVTKSDNPDEEQSLDGYDLAFVSDGRVAATNADALFVRIDPLDPTVVEFALKYSAVGLTMADLLALRYFDCEANKGLQDPQNHHWNDKYTKSEAGSPNPGPGGLSEFGTSGLGNIYELDTLRGGGFVRIEEYCVGDGAANGGADCPCGNNMPAGTVAGCRNISLALPHAGSLTGVGVPSVSADTFALHVVLPQFAPGFMFQGTDAANGGAGRPFGNGLMCVSGSIVRVGKIMTFGGSFATVPAVGGMPLSAQYAIPAGALRHYQAWYRDSLGLCGASFNTTNGVRVLWGP